MLLMMEINEKALKTSIRMHNATARLDECMGVIEMHVPTGDKVAYDDCGRSRHARETVDKNPAILMQQCTVNELKARFKGLVQRLAFVVACVERERGDVRRELVESLQPGYIDHVRDAQ